MTKWLMTLTCAPLHETIIIRHYSLPLFLNRPMADGAMTVMPRPSLSLFSVTSLSTHQPNPPPTHARNPLTQSPFSLLSNNSWIHTYTYTTCISLFPHNFPQFSDSFPPSLEWVLVLPWIEQLQQNLCDLLLPFSLYNNGAFVSRVLEAVILLIKILAFSPQLYRVYIF